MPNCTFCFRVLSLEPKNLSLMAPSMAFLSRRLTASLLHTTKPSPLLMRFSTDHTSNPDSDVEEDLRPNPDPDSTSSSTSSSSQSPYSSTPRRETFQRPLEKGLDPGVYKAILVGQVGQNPIQKRLKSGRPVILFSLGTGGIRNNRRPLDNEEPRDYADRCSVQWHRVAVYPEKLGELAMEQVKPGSIIYVEGNLETKVFSDPISGLVRRIREVAVRRDGRLVFLRTGGGTGESSTNVNRAGYY